MKLNAMILMMRCLFGFGLQNANIRYYTRFLEILRYFDQN